MIEKKEMDTIEQRFKSYIKQGRITKPKPNKQQFFKKKAESSLALAKSLCLGKSNPDWAINIAYYSMFYNATSLLASINKDLKEIDENIHALTYNAIIYYFYIEKEIIKEQYLEDFKKSMEQSDKRLMNLAKQKSEEVFANYKNAKDERGKVTYELGIIAEQKSAETALRRAEIFDRLCEKILFGKI
jgi:uncharacterized protein (UPF0332 family)